MRKLSCKWPKILTIVVLILLTCHIVASVGYAVFDSTRLFERIIGYGICLALTWVIYGIACLMATPSQSASPERPSNDINSEIEDDESDHSKPTGVEMEKGGSKTRMAKVLATICIVTLITIILIGVFLKYRERSDQLSPIDNMPVGASQEVTTEQSEPLAEVEPTQPKKERARQPKAGDVVTNSIGMKLVYIPAGSFMMGSRDSAAEVARKVKIAALTPNYFMDEHPQHRVKITKGFYMGTTQVTQFQYEEIMKINLSNFKGQLNPVERVSWYDAVEFCRKLSEMEGKEYRLPTEAEWEYACRAGTTTPFYTGETISTNQANYDGDYIYGNGTKGIDRQGTIPVGSFSPNGFGLYDMHGNVYEWCQDWYGQNYYTASPTSNPQGPSSGQYRVVRGGSWGSNPGNCRSAYGDYYAPDVRNYCFGFRIVLDLE